MIDLKFSKSLLNDSLIRKRLFQAGIEKSQSLIKQIFNVDKTELKEILKKESEYIYSIQFMFKDRIISACYSLKDDCNILTELFEIRETSEESFEIALNENDLRPTESDFWNSVKKVQDFLESKFTINFTHVDPEEKDSRIKEIKYDENSCVWNCSFTQDDLEGYIDVKYTNFQSLKITQYMIHNIFFD